MISRRLLYLDAQRLSAYLWQAGTLTEEAAFAMRADEHPRFTAYLRRYRNSHFRLLANVSEEGYALETIPFLRGADRQSLLARKISQHFPGSHLTSTLSLGFEKDQRKNEKLLLCALTNSSHFAPWLKCIKDAEAALVGIYTVAQLAGPLLNKLRLPAQRCLLLSLQDDSIRETYLVDGKTRFSRVAHLSDRSMASSAASFAAEAAKLQQYLVSQRLIERHEALPVFILADPQSKTAMHEACRDTSSVLFQVLDNHQQARAIGLKSIPDKDCNEFIFLHLLSTAPPKQQFAGADQRHDYRLAQIRYALVALGAIALLSGAVIAANELVTTYPLHQESRELIAGEAEMSQRYGEISATFPQIAVDHETLRRITIRHAELLAQQKLPGNAYQMISNALEQSPSVQLEMLDWQVGEGGKLTSAANRNKTTLNAGEEIISLRGFIQLDASASARQTVSAFEQFVAVFRVDRKHQVEVLQAPFAIESSQPLRGGDKDEELNKPRQFTLLIRRLAP